MKSKLIQIREGLGLSRYKVAQDTGIHYDTLARIENPKTPTIRREHVRTLQAYYHGLGHEDPMLLEVVLQ